MKKFIILLVSFLGLQACTMPFEEPFHTVLDVPFASNNQQQYLDSKHGSDLVVSAPLTTSNLSGFYRLPPAPKHSKVKIEPPIT